MASRSIIAKVLSLAAEDVLFREHVRARMGEALAQNGFVLADDEMAALRAILEPLHRLNDRAAAERIAALSRTYAGTGETNS